MSKTIRKSLLLVLLICLAIAVLLAGCKSTSVNTKEEIVLQIEKEGLTHFGNVKLNMRTRDFFRETDFEYGDAVRVRFLDYDIVVPIVSAFSLLDIGQTGLDAEDLNPEGLSEQILLFINLDDFATNYGIATKTVYDDGSWEWFPCEGIEFPIDVTLTMEEEGAFPEFSGPPMVVYTSRSAYEDLDDYGFTNIRMVTTPGFEMPFWMISAWISPLIFQIRRIRPRLLKDTLKHIIPTWTFSSTKWVWTTCSPLSRKLLQMLSGTLRTTRESTMFTVSSEKTAPEYSVPF